MKYTLLAIPIVATVVAAVAYFAPVHPGNPSISLKDIQTDYGTTYASKAQPGRNWFVEMVQPSPDRNWFVEMVDGRGADMKTVAAQL